MNLFYDLTMNRRERYSFAEKDETGADHNRSSVFRHERNCSEPAQHWVRCRWRVERRTVEDPYRIRIPRTLVRQVFHRHRNRCMENKDRCGIRNPQVRIRLPGAEVRLRPGHKHFSHVLAEDVLRGHVRRSGRATGQDGQDSMHHKPGLLHTCMERAVGRYFIQDLHHGHH